ncbi:MAG: hypothetical protein EBX41_04045, partial [Chitinophagia bacterium]|nr:hypothetical protein [Chitinophagia bacterium]
PFIATLLPLSLLFITYKLNKKIFWVVAFGFGFFLSNLIFVLQFISCGAAIMADRYSYCAYIGWLFMIAYLLNLVRLHFPQFRSSLVIVLTLFSISLGVLCYGRTLAWHDAESLLTDAIERYPKQALLSYKWRGNFYLDKAYKTNDPSFASKALDDYHILTLLRSADRYVWRNIGKAYSLLGDYNKADEAFNMSTQLEAMGKGALAGDPANQATVIPADNAPVNPNQQPNNNPQDTTLTNQLSAANGKQKADPATEKKINEMAFSHVQAGKFEAALAEYNILLKMNNRNPYYYFYRGVAKYSTGKIQDAITDWEVSMVFNNTEVQKSAAFNLAIAYDTIGNDTMAVRYAKDAQKFGWDVKPEYMAKWQKRADAQKRKK